MNQIAPFAQNATEGDDKPNLLPHNVEAEQQLLGAILTNNDVYDQVASVIDESHFYDPVHQRIFAAIAKMIDRGQIANPVTLKSLFDNDAELAVEGGSALPSVL